jgi:hypothetical protein
MGGQLASNLFGVSSDTGELLNGLVGLSPLAVDAALANSAMNQAAKLNLATREANTTTAANEAGQIVPNPFTTKGVVFKDSMIDENIAVRGIYNDYLAALGGDVKRAYELTGRVVQSGESLPVVRIIGRNEELVRLVPVGNDAGISSFYMSRSQYDMLIGTGKNAQQVAAALGLPASSYSTGGFRGFQAFSIQAQPGKIATAYETTIAPIEQGAFTAQGQLRQLVVPNLKDFTAPKPILNDVIAPAASR